ncbi:MAG TPA: polyprenol monophosphomannose synthase, partial [bacterium]|nr:polyprenol monophosphomannose synthase [bacterium]
MENLPRLLPLIFHHAPAAHVLIVDDNSPDGTGRWVDAQAALDPRIHGLHRPGKMGLGRAYLAGFGWALERDYTHVMEMDADFSHDPAAIPELVAASDTYDVVLGSRFKDGRLSIVNWPLSRLLLSLAAMTYVRIFTGMRMWDTTTGFKCFRREVLGAIDLSSVRSNGYAFQIEVNYKALLAGCTVGEVRIIFADRTAGQSKMNKKIVFEALAIVFKLRWYAWTHPRARRRRVPQSG